MAKATRSKPEHDWPDGTFDVRVEVGSGIESGVIAGLINHTNDRPIGDIPAGHALLTWFNVWVDPGEGTHAAKRFAEAEFTLRRHATWNHAMTPDGRHVPITDAKGNPLYLSADFDLIPDPEPSSPSSSATTPP